MLGLIFWRGGKGRGAKSLLTPFFAFPQNWGDLEERGDRLLHF
jgi:hypothetical protein